MAIKTGRYYRHHPDSVGGDMARNVLYRIQTYDASSVTLIDVSTRRTVMINRGQISSLKTGWGELALTTTGNTTYRITRGLMPKQRAMVRAAFSR